LPPVRCLIVEDEVITAMSLSLELEELGYTIVGTVTTGEEAIAAMEAASPEIVIMDISLKGRIDGIDAAKIILERWETKIIFITGFQIETLQARLTPFRPLAILRKPVYGSQLETIVSLR
jgi:two-component system, response regulator PdtaR